jgi:hypothetical protein
MGRIPLEHELNFSSTFEWSDVIPTLTHTVTVTP